MSANYSGKYGVIIQARMGSSRLPGKVLMDVDGQAMLLRQLRRLKQGLIITKLVVATSNDSSDDAIEGLCRENSFECFRGPLDDVMKRFILCALEFDIDYIIRVGGDDPLVDWECCNTLIRLHRKKAYDFMYASNRDGWPYGCAAELICRKALERIRNKVEKSFYLEHTVPYFFDHPDEFKILKVNAPSEINRTNYYFSVDYPEDLELVRTIFKELENDGDFFNLKKVIKLLDENEYIKKINEHLHEGFDR